MKNQFDPEAEDEIRTAKEIAKRALTLAAVISCAYGESKSDVTKWLKKEQLWKELTPLERNYLENESTDKDTFNFTWRIEALVPLLWVIKKLEKMPGINKECNTEPLKAAVVWPPAQTKEYISSSKLRTEEEINEEYEKLYQAHWKVRDKELNNKNVPKKYNSEVIQERHHGFNWAIGYMKQPWDEITTDT